MRLRKVVAVAFVTDKNALVEFNKGTIRKKSARGIRG